MAGLMYFPSVTTLFLAQPPMYLTTWSGAPMHLAAEAAPLRRLAMSIWSMGAGCGLLKSRQIIDYMYGNVSPTSHLRTRQPTPT
jgi:hypothetical protein